MNICRACAGNNLIMVMPLSRVPQDVQHLLSSQQLGQDSSYITDMRIYQCNDCGLVQAPLCLGTNYYDDYLMTTSFSERLQQYLDELADIFLTQYAHNVRHVLDVGSGDGAFMRPFRQRKITVEGIEPSARSREAAEQQGYRVYPGYMTADTELPGAPYDAFVSRQVLEHVDDIEGFFQGIRHNLSPGAFGVIEVPRLEKALEDRRFYDFFPDHVNYFSLDTLRTVLEINGFSVLATGSMMDDEYNVAIVQLRVPQDFGQILVHRHTLVAHITKLVQDKTQHRIAMWGAGAKGLSILAAMADDKVVLDMVVDSDPNKLGRYTPISEILVQDPENLVSENIDAVIISAIAYESAIINKLQHMAYSGEIYLIRSHGLELYKESK
jgi:SAM-dependent methyltransferase